MDRVSNFISVVRLAGERLKNGKLKSYMTPDIILDDWPKQLTYFNNNFILDLVTKGFDGYEEATYILPIDLPINENTDW